jgi:C-terminal peptidase prc
MGVFLKIRILVSCVALSLLSTPVLAKKKTIEEYWNEIGLTSEDLGFNNTFCNTDEKHFTACFHAMNSALAFEKDHHTLIPTVRLSAEKGFGAVFKDFKSVSIVTPKKLESDDFAVIYETTRKEKMLSSKAIAALYADRAANPVDFDALLDYAKLGDGFKKHESYAVGSMQNAILGILADPHTYIVPTAYMEDENTAGGKDFTGIGAAMKVIKKAGKSSIVVQQPFETGPGYKAGLRANDILTAVDGKSVDGMELTDVVDKIRGPKGTQVKLTVVRGTDTLDFTITRDLIEMKNVEQRMVGAKGEAAYIKLSDFMKRDKTGKTLVYSESKAALEEALKKTPKGVIFDLRDNGGGLLTESIRIASLFLKKGKVVLLTKDLKGNSTRSFKTADEPLTDLPVVLLINGRSASASEIVAGALQDHQRAYLVGERSFGKGTVQNIGPMKSEPRLMLAETIQRFYQPSGRTNQVEGITPDIEAYSNPTPSNADKVAFREEDEYAALSPVGNKWVQTRPAEVTKLQACLDKGEAKANFTKDEAAGVPTDYQLSVAVDTVNCLSDEKIWTPDMAAPVWKAPPGESPVADFIKGLFQ